MKISSKAEYACLAVIELAIRGGSIAAQNLTDLLTRAQDAEQQVLASVTVAQLADRVKLHDYVV